MSQYCSLDLAITDQEALLAALAEMGYAGKVEVFVTPGTGVLISDSLVTVPVFDCGSCNSPIDTDNPVTLIGYDGKPRMLHGREVRAEIVVRREHLWHAANDIGFARQADGTYLAYISEYDREVQPDWHTKLLQAHGVHVARDQLQKPGCLNVEQTRQADGTVVVVGTRYV
jgi:hypothetical protein